MTMTHAEYEAEHDRMGQEHEHLRRVLAGALNRIAEERAQHHKIVDFMTSRIDFLEADLLTVQTQMAMLSERALTAEALLRAAS